MSKYGPAMRFLSKETDMYSRALRELANDIKVLAKRVKKLESKAPNKKRAALGR
jgi:DNA-directed RNA polymerase sigma subunit (sigma70/sigma32)